MEQNAAADLKSTPLRWRNRLGISPIPGGGALLIVAHDEAMVASARGILASRSRVHDLSVPVSFVPGSGASGGCPNLSFGVPKFGQGSRGASQGVEMGNFRTARMDKRELDGSLTAHVGGATLATRRSCIALIS